MLGSHSACNSAMTIPVNPRIDPIDRSMFRDTMIRTIPVAMTATDADWTDRFHRLRAVRNDPPDRMLNPIQMTMVAPIRPSSRVSTSIDSKIDRMDRGGVAPTSGGDGALGHRADPSLPGDGDAPCSASAEQGARITALGVIPSRAGRTRRARPCRDPPW